MIVCLKYHRPGLCTVFKDYNAWRPHEWYRHPLKVCRCRMNHANLAAWVWEVHTLAFPPKADGGATCHQEGGRQHPIRGDLPPHHAPQPLDETVPRRPSAPLLRSDYVCYGRCHISKTRAKWSERTPDTSDRGPNQGTQRRLDRMSTSLPTICLSVTSNIYVSLTIPIMPFL